MRQIILVLAFKQVGKNISEDTSSNTVKEKNLFSKDILNKIFWWSFKNDGWPTAIINYS